MTVAVTDTHALIWWTIGPEKKLSRQARDVFARAEQGRASIYIPVLCFVEVSEVLRRGRLRTEISFPRWMDLVVASSHFVAVDLTPAVVAEAESLYAIPERSDRLIAATAVHLDCPLITQDPAMSRIARLNTVW